jgi:hypothetical protein
MQLPYGTIASSHKGAADLKKLNEVIAQDALTGYLRVSVFDRNAMHECVIVYNAGRPVMSFVSDGTADRKDPDHRQMEEAIRKDNAIVEICKIQENQVKLLQEIYREFAVLRAAAAPVKPVVTEPPKAVAAPRQEKTRQAAPMPEIRGRFIRAENIGDLKEYMLRHPGETGHLLFMAQVNGRHEEQHIILIKGRIEFAYNDRTSGPELLERLKGIPGQTEFYAVEEALLASIVGRYARTTTQPAAEREKPAPGIGISAKDLLEASRTVTSHAREDINRAVGEISGSMDDDIAMVRRVEREFASHVDELLSKLELSHLRSRKKL